MSRRKPMANIIAKAKNLPLISPTTPLSPGAIVASHMVLSVDRNSTTTPEAPKHQSNDPDDRSD
jgi:hypothetical protein